MQNGLRVLPWLLAAGLLPLLQPAAAGATESGAGEPGAAEQDAGGVSGAVLQGLDKITARISTFDAPLGQAVRFGSLQIIARACDKKPPEEPPESAAFLEIVDIRPDSPEVPLFTGWMFASSPAISALEHPVSDVWVVECRKDSISDAVTTPE